MSDSDNHGGGLKGVVDKARDMISGVVGMASASTAGSHDSEAFVTNAAIGDLYEIQAGRLALLRSRSDGVREFAQMMIEHHTSSMHQMQSALMSREARSRWSSGI
jgi:putative membrane protein